MGWWNSCWISYTKVYASRDNAFKLYLWRDGCLFFWRFNTDCGGSGRPAGSVIWTNLLYCGWGEKYLWNRMFSAYEYGRKASVFKTWSGDNDCMGTGRESKLCSGGVYFCGRRGYTMAAWWIKNNWFSGRFWIYGRKSKRY